MPDQTNRPHRGIDGSAPGEAHWTEAKLTAVQRHVDKAVLGRLAKAEGPSPDFQYPVDNSKLERPAGDRPVPLEVSGGQGALTLLINGEPQQTSFRAGQAWWRPDGIGFHRLAVVDSLGRQQQITVRIMPPAPAMAR